MKRELVCIVCPNNCDMVLDLDGGSIQGVAGAACKKGEEYAHQEAIYPRRTFSTLVRVHGGSLPVVSVRVTDAIPRDRIFDIIALLKGLSLTAPVAMNQVVVRDVLGLGADVIATKNIPAEI